MIRCSTFLKFYIGFYSSFWGLPYSILIVYLVKPKKELQRRRWVGLRAFSLKLGEWPIQGVRTGAGGRADSSTRQ